MDFLPEHLDDYITTYSEDEPQILQELTRETYLKVLMPQMLSGHYQGRVLASLSQIIAPRRILEIGTYTGYSAICLAEGLQEGGELITIDKNEERDSLVKRYFVKYKEQSDKAIELETKIGDASQIIPTLAGGFDLIFIDADKPNYSKYLDLVVPLMNENAVLLSDNVLWYGKVATTGSDTDPQTAALQEYNKKVKNHPDLSSVILPIRDGLTLSRKRNKSISHV